MSYALERKLIEGRFKGAMPEDAEIQWGNTPYQPTPAGFCRITILSGGGSELLAITGGDLRRYGGVIDVGIFVPVDGGTVALREQADLIENALAHQDLTESTTRIITYGSDFRDLGKIGDWYQGSVSIRFQRDLAGIQGLRGQITSFAGAPITSFGGDPLTVFAGQSITIPFLTTFSGQSLTTFAGEPITALA